MKTVQTSSNTVLSRADYRAQKVKPFSILMNDADIIERALDGGFYSHLDSQEIEDELRILMIDQCHGESALKSHQFSN